MWCTSSLVKARLSRQLGWVSFRPAKQSLRSVENEGRGGNMPGVSAAVATSWSDSLLYDARYSHSATWLSVHSSASSSSIFWLCMSPLVQDSSRVFFISFTYVHYSERERREGPIVRGGRRRRISDVGQSCVRQNDQPSTSTAATCHLFPV